MSDQFPKMVKISQSYPAAKRLNISSLVLQQFGSSGIGQVVKPGMRIALGVGSRGIANLGEIVKAAVDVLIGYGARPFLQPAMGSHGGATPDGQAKILANYGITPETMGVPIETSMAVSKVGTALREWDVVFSTQALEADGVVVLNRIKPHTDFRGSLGSGIQKMLTIGFGKQAGAAIAHRAAAHVGHEVVIREFSRVILDSVPILCGVAIIEDQHHQIADIEVIRPENIARDEDRLFQLARSLMPRLPLDEIDLLIVDQIGKEISGAGMDTNIIGRDISGYHTSLHGEHPLIPRIFRIFVRDLSLATNGNGVGIGLADFTTTRAVKSLDLHATYVNSLTAIGLHPAKIPIHFDSDREAIHAALLSLAPAALSAPRVIRIQNTLSLDRMLVSESCVKAIEKGTGIRIEGEPLPMAFDGHGNLKPFAD